MVQFLFLSLIVAVGCSESTPESGLVVSGENTPIPGFGGGGAGGGVPGGTPRLGEPESLSDAGTDAGTDAEAEADGQSEVETDGIGPIEADVESVNDADVQVSEEDSIDVEEPADTSAPDETWSIDISDVECLFIPEVAAFAPVLECQWSGSLESPKHNDVVMTPVVANLSDDDMDGDVDIQDIPDIAFISYRYQEDGCCSAPGVLRIVSGSCSKEGASIVLQSNELQEHTTIDAIQLDNSGGLVVGDVDHDGQMEIFAMRKDSGSVLFSGIEYPDVAGSSLTYEGAEWQVTGNLDPVLGLQLEDGDETTLSSEVPGAQVLAKVTVPPEPAALAQLRVRVRARATDGTSKIAARLVIGETILESSSRTVSSSEYQTFRFEFPKNPSSGELRQWRYSDLQDMEFGAFHAGPEGTGVVLTELVLEMGAVYLEWASPYPQKGDIARGAQPSMVDVNQDGVAELLVGRTLIDPQNGEAIWVGDAGMGINGFIGPISFAADLDLDGVQEVIAGNTLYNATGEIVWEISYGDEGSGCKSGGHPCDGFNAVGNFDTDPEGEIATVRNGVVYVFDHDGTKKAMRSLPQKDCSKNEGGPPTVADFDNDGEAEIGVAGADYYFVVDWECCTDPLDCSEVPAGKETSCEDPGIRWKVENDDCTSRVTGSSVFDFEGDGAAEVIYNDEEFFRIFDGETGALLLEVANTSHTRLEYPVIVDADRDGNAEIVFVENKDDAIPLQVWGDPADNWVPTRTIWNQHAYHITHILEDGTLPEPTGEASWLTHNTFRQNLPDFDPFLAPDLFVEWSAPNYDTCPETLSLEGEVCNGGLLWTTGVDVRIYGQDNSLVECDGGIQMDKTLEPGECSTFSCAVTDAALLANPSNLKVCVDGFDSTCEGPGFTNECNETNNLDTSNFAPCSAP